MAKDSASSAPKSKAELREQRLKQALKANMARRKAQTRARSTPQADVHKGPAEPKEEGS